MLKLWDSYDSCQHYLDCCEQNGNKGSPEILEDVKFELPVYSKL